MRSFKPSNQTGPPGMASKTLAPMACRNKQFISAYHEGNPRRRVRQPLHRKSTFTDKYTHLSKQEIPE